MFARRKPQHYEYAPEVRRVIAAAGREAVRLRHPAVGTEHLLLAALREPATPDILRGWGSDPADIERAIQSRLAPGHVKSDAARPLAPDAMKAMGSAMAAGRAAGGTVTLAHLLAAAIAEAGASSERGITIPTSSTRPASVAPADPVVHLDDTSVLPISEQIVSQITESVATGRLAPGERLPAVRQLADMLQIAPGTVARAYAELERRGVVTTEGARGTRISFEVGSSARGAADVAALASALRPIVVEAYHAGAGSADLRRALDEAMRGIYT